MKRLVHILLSLLIYIPIQAQDYEWVEGINSTNYSSMSFVDATENGYIYTAGQFTGSITVGSASISTAGSAYLLAKMDSMGVYSWAETLEGSLSVTGISHDAIGNLFVVGSIYGYPVNFGSTVVSSGPALATFLLKYDTNGTLQWYKTEANQSGNAIDVDSTGYITIATNFSGVATVGGSSYYTGAGMQASGLIIRYDPAGTFEWAEQIYMDTIFSNSPYLSLNDVEVNEDGDVFVLGEYSNGGLIFGTDTTFNTEDSSDVFIVRIDDTGVFAWSKFITGLGHQSGQDLCINDSGFVYVTGIYTNTTNFEPGVSLVNPPTVNYYLAKYYDNSLFHWVTSGNTSASGYASSMGVTSNADYDAIITGSFSDTLTSWNQTIATTSPVSYETNTMVTTYDLQGNIKWMQEAGDVSTTSFYSCSGRAISSDPFGNIYIAGQADDNSQFGPFIFNNNGNQDLAYVARLKENVPPMPTDSVWPGDANNDLVANNIDLLAVGVGFGATGPVRPNASNLWTPQPAFDWSQSLSSGVDYKFVDCNGDGVIDAQDTVAINLNYGLTHNKTDGIEDEMGIPLYFDFLQDSLQAGDTADVLIMLGTDSMPAVDFYGIAFTVNLDSNLMDINSPKVSYDSSWAGSLGNDMLAMDRNFPADQKIDIGITRIDHQDSTGYGEIARLSIIMVDDLTAKTVLAEVLTLSFANAYMISSDETVVGVDLQSDTIVVYQEEEQNTSIASWLSRRVNIYPNPATDRLVIELDQLRGTEIRIFDTFGRNIYAKKERFTRHELQNLDQFAPGMYFLSIMTDQGETIKKFWIR